MSAKDLTRLATYLVEKRTPTTANRPAPAPEVL
jgi:hypothetical protein